jgi:uncharacterized membrane protein
MDQQAFSNKHKHLEFVQAAVNRMASNLFLLKGWSVTLIAALFALAAKDANQAYVLIAYFPLLIFWCLDAYFLRQERRFRALYNQVRQMNEADIDFSMNTEPFSGDIRNTWASALFSPTLFFYYGGLGSLMSVLIHLVR